MKFGRKFQEINWCFARVVKNLGLESDDRDPERDRERETFKRRGRNRDLEPPKRGHTVYIYGHNMGEEMVRKYFSNIGKIVNLSMEPEKRYLQLFFFIKNHALTR